MESPDRKAPVKFGGFYIKKENSHTTPRNCSKAYPSTQVAPPQDMPLWDEVSATTVPKARQRWAYSRQCEDS